MRRLGQMRAQTDLVAHCAGEDPEAGFFAGEGGDVFLEGVDGGVAGFVVHVVLEGCVYDCLFWSVSGCDLEWF